MKFIVAVLLLGLAACATTQPTPAPTPTPAPAPSSGGIQGVICPLGQNFVAAFVPKFAASLNCVNVTQMTIDITNGLNVGNFCPVVSAQQALSLKYKGKHFPLKGPLANMFCPIVIDAVAGAGGDAVLPTDWQCNPATAQTSGTVANTVNQLCLLIPL